MVDLSNSFDWYKIYESLLFAQADPAKPGKFYPIPSVIVEETLATHTIGVKIQVSNAKPRWRLGAVAFPIVNVLGSELGKARHERNHFIPLRETTIIQFQRISGNYQLALGIPYWFEDVFIEVWKFIGQEPVASIENKLVDIEARLIDLRTIVQRIEERI